MSPEQCRAARAWLGWSQRMLATKARVGIPTVVNFERRTTRPLTNNHLAMQRAIEGGGIELIDEGGVGVGIRLARDRSPKM